MTDYRSDERFNPECKNPKCECDDTLEWSTYIELPHHLYEFPNRFGKGYKMYEVCYLDKGWCVDNAKEFKVYVDGCFKPYIERWHTPIEWQDGTKWWEIEGLDDKHVCTYNGREYNVIQVLVSDSGCKWWFFNGKQVWGRPIYIPALDWIFGERYVKTSEVQKQIEEATTARSAALKEQKRHEEYWRKKEEKKEVIQAWVLGTLMAITPLYVFFFC